jgi:hypothetical protein
VPARRNSLRRARRLLLLNHLVIRSGRTVRPNSTMRVTLYVLRNRTNRKRYVGITNDLPRRLLTRGGGLDNQLQRCDDRR